jgi:hypothetical protein
MVKIITTTQGKKEEHEIGSGPGGFTCIVHQQGIKVDVPEFVEINPRNTIDCMANMKQTEWEWISQGSLFTTLFNAAFDRSQPIPATIQELNDSDFGIIHIAGMIVLCCEAFFAKKSVFVRNPETYLHPSTERMVVTMFYKMMELCGVGGKVVKTEIAPEKTVEPAKSPEPVPSTPTNEYASDKALVIKWLKAMEPSKQFAKVGVVIYTVADLILEVTQDSLVGKQLIDRFNEMRTS